MGLKGTPSPKARRIQTSIMALALVAQSLYGLILAPTAHAASTIAVSPDAMHSWQTVDTGGNGGSIHFVNTLGSNSLGSAQFALPGSDQSQSLGVATYATTKLADIITLSYFSNVQTGSSAAPSLQLAIDTDVTDDDNSSEGQLVYSPYENGEVIPGEWQYQNARGGLWWSDSAALALVCPQLNPCSLDAIITLYPNAGIASSDGVSLTAVNSGSEPSVSHVDGFMFNDITYNFEAITAPLLSTPAHDDTLDSSTLIALWQPVAVASGYVYESYNDEAATQVRVSETVTDTQKTEDGLANGTSLWWRVKTVDQQGDSGVWSELRKVTVVTDTETEEENSPGAGIVSGGGSGQTQELLTQLARLNEPFALPNPVEALVAPQIMSAIDTAGANSDIREVQKAMNTPMTDTDAGTVAAVPTENGWKFFGILWYWWALPVIIIGTLAVRSVKRPQRNFLYSSDQV